MKKYDLKPEEVLYMGDDIPDYEVLNWWDCLAVRRMRLLKSSRYAVISRTGTVDMAVGVMWWNRCCGHRESGWKKKRLSAGKCRNRRTSVCCSGMPERLNVCCSGIFKNKQENVLDNLKKYRIILASNSPRRKELLGGLGIDYEVKVLPGIDESYPDSLKGRRFRCTLHRKRRLPTGR